MLQGLTGAHLIVVVFLVVLLFGAPKLPALAKSLRQSMKILKQEVGDINEGPAEAAKPGDTPNPKPTPKPTPNSTPSPAP